MLPRSTAPLGLFAQDTLIEANDAVVTPANIMAHESLWRLGIAAEVLALICAVVLAMIYFALLEHFLTRGRRRQHLRVTSTPAAGRRGDLEIH